MPMFGKIVDGLSKAGKNAIEVIKNRNFQRGALAAVPATLTALYYIRKYKKQAEEKEELYKKALSKHNAIIKQLNTKVEMDKERQDRLLAYDTQIKKEMNALQFEIQRLNEQIAELEKKKAKDE